MALAIDASSPAITGGAGPSVTTTSFTPPAGSILLIRAAMDGGAAPGAPSITDNLGAHLTYTRTDWQSGNVSPNAGGQAVMWWAPVASSAAMTVTVTNGDGAAPTTAVKVTVLTGADTVTPIGAHGAAGSKSASSIAQSYTASATSGWGFLVDSDFDQLGAETAGVGCTSDGSANQGTAITYGFFRRTTADDTSGNSNALNATLPGTSTNLSWVYVEVLPASGAAAPSFVAGPRIGPGPGRLSPTGRLNPWFGTGSGLTASAVGITDAGSGSDAAAVTAAVPLAEVGSGSDAAAVSAAVPLADTGSAGDSIAVTVPVPLADSGTAVDVLAATASVPLAETSTGADALTAVATLALADAGSASDALAAGVPIGVADSGAGSDAVAATAVVHLVDAGSAADVLTVTVTLAVAETASAADTIRVLAALAQAEAAAALDVLGAVASVALPDIGAAADAVVAQQQGGPSSITLTDLAAARDRIHVLCAEPNSGTTIRSTSTTTRPDSGITYYQ